MFNLLAMAVQIGGAAIKDGWCKGLARRSQIPV